MNMKKQAQAKGLWSWILGSGWSNAGGANA